MAIRLITGVPGSGKTLYALNFVKAWAEKENRPVYYSGIPELTLPWLPLEKAEDWFRCEPNSIIVIDEAQRVFRPRGTGSAVPEHVSKLETHRHLGIDLVIITQHPMLVDTNIRRLIERHFHVKRVFGLQKATIHEFTELKQNPDTNREGSIRHDFVYPKNSYKWYKSAEVHTHKASIPKRLIFLALSPLVVLGLGYLTVRHFVEYITGGQERVMKSAQKGASNYTGSSVGLGGNRGVGVGSGGRNGRDDYEWLAVQKPRIVGLPHTAPMYDELAKVSSMPVPAACIIMRDVCACYTEQGTRIPNVQDVICRDVVNNGWFNPYRQNQAVVANRSASDKAIKSEARGTGAGEARTGAL